jgi:S1-C subfamily serine protease
MKLLTVWAIALSAGLAAFAYGAFPEPSLQKEVLNATVRVEVGSKTQTTGSGSGVAIGKRHVFTNHHVVASAIDDDKMNVVVRGWVREDDRVFPLYYRAKILRADKATDLALLELDADWVGAIGELARTEPKEADTVCKSGAQGGRRPRVACGEWFGHDENPIDGMIHVTSGAATAPGDSGGGVWSAHEGRYKIVAVTRAVPMIPMGMGATLVTTTGVAIPLENLRSFLFPE